MKQFVLLPKDCNIDDFSSIITNLKDAEEIANKLDLQLVPMTVYNSSKNYITHHRLDQEQSAQSINLKGIGDWIRKEFND